MLAASDAYFQSLPSVPKNGDDAFYLRHRPWLLFTASIVSQKGRNWQFDFVYCWFDFSANAAPSGKQEDQGVQWDQGMPGGRGRK